MTQSFDLRVTGETSRVGAVPRKEDPRYSELEGRKTQTAGVSGRLKFAPGHTLEAGWIDGQEDRWRDDVRTRPTILLYKDRYDIERNHGYLAWRGEFGGWRAQANVYRSEFDVKNSRTNGVTPTTPQNFRDDAFDALAATRLGTHRLTFGGEYRTETMTHPHLATGKDDATHKALFIQDELPLGTHLALTAGLRADNHEFFGTELSPRAYLVWEATPELVVKGGYGHAFKAPTLKQVSPVYVGAAGPHSFYGNADIKPEKSDSLEIGADWQRGSLNLRGVLFHTRVKDMISTKLFRTDPPPSNRRHYLYVNLDEAVVNGLEAGFSWDIASGLSWQTDLTLLRTRDKVKDKEMYARPRTSAASRLDWKAGDGWSARLGVEYTGSQLVAVITGATTSDVRLPAYSLWNASVGKRFGKAVTARVGIDNLTNVRLAEESPNFGYAERGRTLFASLQADF